MSAVHGPAGVPPLGAVQLARLLGMPDPTDEQAAVICAPLTPGVVIAGAGSGKTETIAARVVWLVANGLVAPDSVLGLTFTRKAAGELGSRIRRRLSQWRRVLERDAPDEQDRLAALRAGEPTVLTYASYAARLVGEHALRVGIEPDARLLSPALAWQLADAVVRGHTGPLPTGIGMPSSLVDYVLALAAHCADHLVDPQQVEAFCQEAIADFDALPLGAGIRSERPGKTGEYLAALEHRLALVPLVQEFLDAKARLGAVDFGDQMRIAAQLGQLAEVREVERARYAAVVLDEYQDTGHAQIEMLHGLFGGGHPVTAVGDPFQSIYGWRGASAGNIGVFDRRFAHADGSPAAIYPLATSFRNDAVILQAANAVAEPLRGAVVTLSLRPFSEAGPGTIHVARTETVDGEAAWIAAQLGQTWTQLPAGARTAAVLVRRRSQIPLIAEALQAEGLPVEVVGLGGLLTTPEIVDVVATLRVIADHRPGTSLMRLLTGARWRIGPADLAALRNRASWLVRPRTEQAVGTAAFVPDGEREQLSLAEALDDPGPAERYSPEGHRRLSALAAELRSLRRAASTPLPELVAAVEQVIGVDIEVAARGDRAAVGRAHLDRFLDEAARFATEAEESTLRAFLAYLDAAEEEENGLEAGEVVVETERVQVLTVHGAKGLEWDVVAVPGLVEDVFPAKAQSVNWTRARHELPGPLRGDADDLPVLDLGHARDRKQVRDLLAEHNLELLARHAMEERRLAYVAFTRARHVLIGTGYCWDATQSPRQPAPYLVELAGFAARDMWFEPEPDSTNPLELTPQTATWPADPLGPRTAGAAGRRALVSAGAELVSAAACGALADVLPFGRVGEWAADVDVLLAERARLHAGTVDVTLPRHLSVSQLVDLQRDPDDLARRLRRPLPLPPAPWARRGTAFHAWLEQRWQLPSLLDVDELPGAADADADDSDLEALREAFERSGWAARTPVAVEVPFEMAVDGSVVRGRMDAVFRTAQGQWEVVDWKTGSRPSGAAARAAAVQLAAYRLAWARLNQIPDAQLHTVRAAFHYVRGGQTVSPADLLDAAGLRALILGREDG